jgi:hypothetical protein
MRKNVMLQCPIVCIIEAAPGLSASTISRDIEEANIPDLVVMSERSGYMEGVVKNDAITYEYYVELKRVMTVGCLTYWDQLITNKRRPQKTQAKFENMISNLRAVPLQSNQVDGDKRYKITAKIGGTPDDMLIAAMMCLYWRGHFWRDPTGKYANWKNLILSRSNQRFLL